ncbi:hypothetical protein SAMN03159316_5088 [Pseudomonas sp. NFR02]|nr:hypothetical protein SAMN03159316_5088 [Pseudomonas sp. NFR02]
MTIRARVEYFQKNQVGCHVLKRFNTDMMCNFNFGGPLELEPTVTRKGTGAGSSVSRADCAKLFGKLVPQVIVLMFDNPSILWGRPCYPCSGSSSLGLNIFVHRHIQCLCRANRP